MENMAIYKQTFKNSEFIEAIETHYFDEGWDILEDDSKYGVTYRMFDEFKSSFIQYIEDVFQGDEFTFIVTLRDTDFQIYKLSNLEFDKRFHIDCGIIERNEPEYNFSYYLELKKWDVELERVCEGYELDSEAMIDFSTEAYHITRYSNLLIYVEPKPWINMSYDKFYNDIETVMADELNRVKESLYIKPEFDRFLSVYYSFRFDCYKKGWINDSLEYIERFFDVSHDPKNWDVIPEDAEPEKIRSMLMDVSRNEICYHFRKWAEYQPLTMVEKADYILEFWDSYEARNTPYHEFLEIFRDNETYSSLFNHFNEWTQCLLWADPETGEPSEDNFIDGFILDLIRWY